MKHIFFLLSLVVAQLAFAQSEDAYTRYELLDPAQSTFRIVYDVSSVEAGAMVYYNTLRKGSEHKVDAVVDLASGLPLKWEIVNGADAKKAGYQSASEDVDYLKAYLSRPVPAGGEFRLRIDKTYKDSKSYFASGDHIVFDRSLGVKRNSVLLPRGYELLICNFPSQVQQEPDGRIKISFINAGPADAPLHMEARKLPGSTNLAVEKPIPVPLVRGEGRDKSKARTSFTFSERAYQNREIVYFLQQPETHAFRLYHDYTETREGMDRYVNVVRAGSRASNPSARNLDTGEALKVETLRGAEITKRQLDIGESVTAETEIVVIWYPAVKKGASTRLRIEETYTDANRYVLDKSELVFDRSFGRPYNSVVLPEGWFLTSNYIPAAVELTKEGLVQLNYVGNDPDEMDVHIKARRR